MKVMLIAPPLKVDKDMQELTKIPYPIGLAYIAANLEKNGFEVKILDTLVEGWDMRKTEGDSIIIGLPDEVIKAKIKSENPDVFGISAMFTTQSEQPHRIAKLIKEIFPDKKIIAGGAHASASAAKMLEDPNFDFIVIGEGEKTLVNLLKNLKKPEKVNGIAFRDKSKIKFTKPAEFIQNLDELPFPAYHLLNVAKYKECGKKGFSARKYIGDGDLWATVITSRGCPFDCIFCSVHKTVGYKWRPRSPNNVVDEMEFLYNKYGIRTFFFEDDNFSLDVERAKKILSEVIKRKLDIKWSAPNGIRADRLDEELIDLIKATKCTRIRVAIEHGDQKFLNEVVNKRMDLSKLKDSVKLLRSKGIDVDGFFIFGIPGETDDTARNSLNFAKELSALGLNPIMGMAIPLPGTKMYDICNENNYLTKKNLTQKDYQLSYAQKTVINTPTMPAEKLEKWYFQALKETLIVRAKKNPRVLLNLNVIQDLRRHPIRAYKILINYIKGFMKGMLKPLRTDKS